MESNSLENPSLPLVSIIAICHRHAQYVLQTLDSIRNQTYAQVELIIINNVKDDCEPLIRKWIVEHQVDCEFIQNEVPLKITENLNLGLQHVRGAFFQGISCDDVLMPDKLNLQVNKFLSSDPNVACIYSDATFINEFGVEDLSESLQSRKEKKWKLPLFAQGNLWKELNTLCYIPAPTVLLRTSVIMMLGKYNEKYSFEDWPMWLAMSKAGYEFGFVENSLVQYRVLNDSLGSNYASNSFGESLIRFYKDNIDNILFQNPKTFNSFFLCIYRQNKSVDNFILLVRVFLKSQTFNNLKFIFRYLFN